MDTSTAARSGRQESQELLRHPEGDIGAVLRDLESLDSDQVLAATEMVERVSRAVEAAQVLLAGRIAELSDKALGDYSLATQRGCRNDSELLQRVTRASIQAITRRKKLAAQVSPRLSLTGEGMPPLAPHVATALAAGDLSMNDAELITTTLARVSDRASVEELDVAERVLVETATGAGGELPVHADDLRVYCRVWGARLDQDGTEPVETCPEEKRWFKIGQRRDGLVSITGALLPETAAVLGRLIDAVNSPRVRGPVRFRDGDCDGDSDGDDGAGADAGAAGADAGAAGADDGGATGAAGAAGATGAAVLAVRPDIDPRTGGQKRHDALSTVLEVIARHPGVPLLGGAPVTVLIQANESDVKQGTGVGWVFGYDGQPTDIPMNSVRHAACSGSVQRVIQDDHGRIVKLGVKDRVFNAQQRRAITLRDGGCVIPGCTVPGSWCEIHHVEEWANGGPTHTDNGALICWHHHRNLDVSGWRIRMNDGVPEVRPPDWVDPEQRWYRTGSPLRAPSLAAVA